MAVKRLVLNCTCSVTMCDHAKEEVGNILQDTYDDAYDEGWNDAFVSVRETLVEMGFEKAAKMSTPPPPPKNPKANKLRSPGTKPNELVN